MGIKKIEIPDLVSEGLITIKQAQAEFEPKRTLGTWYSWAKDGYEGVKLETRRWGGTLCTSRQAVSRFVERISTDRIAVTQRQAETARDRASRYLDSLGICA